MSSPRATIILVLAVIGLALALTPVVLHAGFGIEVWPLTRLSPTVPAVDGGMAVAAELLTGSVALWSLIRDNKTFQIPSLQQRGKSMGIVRLDDSLADLVRAGKVTLEEARAFADAPDELAQSLAGPRPNLAPRKAG